MTNIFSYRSYFISHITLPNIDTHNPAQPIVANVVSGVSYVEGYATNFVRSVSHIGRVLRVSHAVPKPEYVINVKMMRPAYALAAEPLDLVQRRVYREQHEIHGGGWDCENNMVPDELNQSTQLANYRVFDAWHRTDEA